ncbi:CopD family protein [Salinisphaera sp. P385]|uniref:CopD family protein n=1 Tax=Spectribacter acetivorans TaxID=3075603 RepID=A0ABU3B502_9GAMM|nr:CopD family protein [Salinisphaera sp. P385]MDT0617150.1 CopD family protein [Salinisphaera sp. P385]
MSINGLAIALHVLAAVVWVGGMFFAYMALRPAAGQLALADRLALWAGVFARFFPFVWLSVIALLATGYWLIFAVLGGMGGAGTHVHIMHGLGWLMFALFGHVYFAPWRRLRLALEAGTLNEGARYLNQIRVLIGVNLLLGLIVVAVAAGGRYGLLPG